MENVENGPLLRSLRLHLVTKEMGLMFEMTKIVFVHIPGWEGTRGSCLQDSWWQGKRDGSIV